MIASKRNRLLLGVLIVCVFFFCVVATEAQEKSGVFGPGGTSANEGPFEFEFDGAVKIVFDELKIGGWQNNAFYVAFIVTSPEDMIFKISNENCIAYDNKGNEFYYANRWIGNTEISERRIIGGVPTRFGFYFHRNGIEVAEIYSRIDVNIMGKVVTMRNVPSTK